MGKAAAAERATSRAGGKAGDKGKSVPRVSTMNYQAATKWLNGRVNYEKQRTAKATYDDFKLDRMHALLESIGNPQRGFKSVHVAGSKGKGSVVEMLSAMLGGCGYAVGVYTSPHLIHERERIRIGREPIGTSDFAHAMNRCRTGAEKIEKKHGQATYFELLTAAAFCYFCDKAVDVAVVETGLGGRLDATNTLEPEVCAITQIQLEHTHVLGDTLAKIAAEKAGIFKPGVPVVTVEQDDEALDALTAQAEMVGAPLSVLGDQIKFTNRFVAAHHMGPHMRVTVKGGRSEFEHLPVPLIGVHQGVNCGLALAVVDRLHDRGFVADGLELEAGLAKTIRNGRGEQVLESPRIVVDGAHTPASIAALVRSLGSHMRYDSMVVVFGCAADKDVDGMLAELARGADKVIFTKAADTVRAMEPADLQRRFAETSPKMAQAFDTLKEAINAAAAAIDKRHDLICVTGSFYVAGEAKKLIGEKFAGKQNKGGTG